MRSEIVIGHRSVGPSHPTYIVAEISANHDNDFNKAVASVEAAKLAGADAVKLQTYTADTLTISSDRKWFIVDGGTPWDGRSLYDLYAEASMPWEWQPRLKEVADEIGLQFFSTAYDLSSLRFLEELGIPVHKVASFENVDIPLIEAMAETRKPIIISTGMATKEEIREAVNAARRNGEGQVALLNCTSAYPADPEDMNLATIPDLAREFDVVSGLSDHTLGHVVTVAGVVLGASIVEKHFTLDRGMGGPDSSFSMEPDEFREMVDAIRVAEKAVGSLSYGVGDKELKSRVFRRSLFVVQDMEAGAEFTQENVRSIRPGYGLPPKHYAEVLGRNAACNIERGTPLDWTHVAGRER